MTVRRGRVVHGGARMEPVGADAGPTPRRMPSGRVESKAVVDLAIAAQNMVERARAEAASIVQAAQAERDRLVAQARREGLEQATAKLASAWIALRAREATADRNAEERVIAVARLLAERLLGEALRVEPSTVAALAREAMRPLRRARRVTIEAHPDDADVLRANLASLPVEEDIVEVLSDMARQRGCVRIVSDLGTLDAELAPQLDRLTDALRRELLAP